MGNKNTRGIPQENPNAPRSRNNSDTNSDDVDRMEGMIYSSDEKRVTIEDFDILKLIGKGNERHTRVCI